MKTLTKYILQYAQSLNSICKNSAQILCTQSERATDTGLIQIVFVIQKPAPLFVAAFHRVQSHGIHIPFSRQLKAVQECPHRQHAGQDERSPGL